MHNTRVYANSAINKKISSREYTPYYRELLPGHIGVPVILLVDPAYPLLPNVTKEYSNCMEAKHIIFNNKLRTTRNQTECAFGRLKARWRILNRSVDVGLEFAVSLIYACFISHNSCEIKKVDIQHEVLQEQLELEHQP